MSVSKATSLDALCNHLSSELLPPPPFFSLLKDSSSDRLRPKLWPDPTGHPANTTGYLIQLAFFSTSRWISVTVSLPLSNSVHLTLSLSPFTPHWQMGSKKRERKRERPHLYLITSTIGKGKHTQKRQKCAPRGSLFLSSICLYSQNCSGYKYRSGVCVSEWKHESTVNEWHNVHCKEVCVFVCLCQTSWMAQCRLWSKAQA